MRNRYVIQVLLATFGFGLLLAVVAVLETPADRPVQGTGAPRGAVESPQCHATTPPALPQKAAPRTDDFKDDCEYPAQLCND